MAMGEERAGAALMAGIAPRDGVEAALAEQMAACHEAALGCLANARREDLPESARTAELRTGARLMGLFTQQLGALERHRAHLRLEHEAAESAAREAEEAVIYPDRHVRRLAARAALAGPTTDEAIVERLARRFERRINGEGDEGDEAEDGGDGQTAPAPQSVGAAVPGPNAAPESPLNRQQRRALDRKRRRERRRLGA